MNCFNRKKLIPSLATSVMIAATTLALLPGFLTSGNVYADPALVSIPVGLASGPIHTASIPVPTTTPVTSTASLLSGNIPAAPAPVLTPTHHPVEQPSGNIPIPVSTPLALHRSIADVNVNGLARLTPPNTVTVGGMYRCSNNSGATAVSVTITPLSEGTKTVEGSNTTNIVCNNQDHPVIVPVTITTNSTHSPNTVPLKAILPSSIRAIVAATLTDTLGNHVSSTDTRPILIIS